MWDNLLRVDWGRLCHAYGRARDLPDILGGMVGDDEDARAAGWDAFWGAVNHQGDFYDSTVAAVPFLIEAVARRGTPERAQILSYFRDRWLDAPDYGGDPLLIEPPGGMDVPTPMLTDGAGLDQTIAEGAEQDGEDELDPSSFRRMDLSAWQTGRAIQAGRPTFESLLDDPDREVAAAAAALLLLWSETRPRGKQALVRAIAEEAEPVEQARRILELGVYAAPDDAGTLAEWVAPHQAAVTQAAAALVWAWVVDPAPLPEPAAAALRAASEPGSDAFARLPWVGAYRRGPWVMPANAADLVLRLADSEERAVRWRAVQGLQIGRETAKHLSAAQVVPVLLKRLSDDDYNRIRAAAAMALSQRGDSVFGTEPKAVPALIRALEGRRSPDWGDGVLGLDSDASVCGHAARILVALSSRLTSEQRQEALVGIDRAAHRYAGSDGAYVWFLSMAVPASSFLRRQRQQIAEAREWGPTELLAEFAFPNREDSDLSPDDCDRRLAEAYARAPDETIAAAIDAVRAASNRSAYIGAAAWLMTLGPAAEPALEALDAMPGGPVDDDYARWRARSAAAYIRQSLLIARDRGDEPSPGEPSARRQVAGLLRAAAGADQSGGSRSTLILEVAGLIEHPDAYVRASAAEGLALLTPAPGEVAAALPVLERMLADEAFAEVGIAGAYVCAGRLFHWRRERRSPRAGAISALLAAGWIPEGDRMLAAMLEQSTHAKVVCGDLAELHRFPIAQWRLAVAAAGGPSAADPRIRAIQQLCQGQARAGNNGPQACAAELAEVVRRLSGRVVP